ncbi:MAG: precorrin-6y C5,15-methyltransferase (decarboxylating) subunit CbiE [Desulfofustis sp.]|nr:precorrin-6y C5,15-methyltransferase (decarboxylating) subunit CbiE [Desulfofustis sp.]
MGTITVVGMVGERLPEGLRQLLSEPGITLVSSAALRDTIMRLVPAVRTIRWLSITPLGQCLEKISRQLSVGPILVVVTGDPLFFGFGRLIRERFPGHGISFEPSLSTMQLCFARFGIPWDDAQFLSLHGRPLQLLEQKLQAKKVFVFTDPVNSPAAIARFLLDRLGARESFRYRLHVAECLGTARERLIEGDPATLAEQVFNEPNCLILSQTTANSETRTPRFGLQEQDLAHSRGLITKREVRAAVLHTLLLPDRGVLWDVGAGSGSVGIEAARLFPELTVYSIEKEAEECAHIRKNREQFRCWNLTIVPAAAPAALERLPLPDRVFVGGTGGNLEEVVQFLIKTIARSTIIVLTAVSEKTRVLAPRLLAEGGWRVTVSRISVSRFDYPDRGETRLNPIDIIKAERDDD